MRLLIAAVAVLTLAASAHGRTVSKPVGLWIRKGNTTTIVVWPQYQQPQRTVYYPVVVVPTCKPSPLPQQRARYQPSKYSPSR